MDSDFTFLLFSTEADFIRRAVAAGVDGVIVDWECFGKEARQASADTQINNDTMDDLRRVRASTEAPVICRLNRCGETTANEVRLAIEAGADEILLPMVRTVEEVEEVIALANDDCGVGILVETMAAVGLVDSLAKLSLSRVYVGLNDLAIERKTATIFTAVADGTIEHIRRRVGLPFGFGGLTLPDKGSPIPCRLLIGEMARLDCNFTFLRRFFLRDVPRDRVDVAVSQMREALWQAWLRSAEEVARDRRDLEEAIWAWTDRLAVDREPSSVV